jgi:hypothetical protein
MAARFLQIKLPGAEKGSDQHWYELNDAYGLKGVDRARFSGEALTPTLQPLAVSSRVFSCTCSGCFGSTGVGFLLGFYVNAAVRIC